MCSARLKYSIGQATKSSSEAERLDVHTEDEDTGKQAIIHYLVYRAARVLRTLANLTNGSLSEILVTQLASFTMGDLTKASERLAEDYVCAAHRNEYLVYKAIALTTRTRPARTAGAPPGSISCFCITSILLTPFGSMVYSTMSSQRWNGRRMSTR